VTPITINTKYEVTAASYLSFFREFEKLIKLAELTVSLAHLYYSPEDFLTNNF